MTRINAGRASPSTSEQAAEPAREEIPAFIELVSMGINKQGQIVFKTEYLQNFPGMQIAEKISLRLRPLSGKEWIEAAFKRRPDELRKLPITKAGAALADESKTASDCAEELSPGYCTNVLRTLNIWIPKPRGSLIQPRQYRK